MNREETLAWAKSLRPGAKVILESGFNWETLSILTVTKVTPSGWVKTTNGDTFSQTSWRDSLYSRGGHDGRIVPATDDLIQEAQRQDAKREEEKRKRQVIIKARNMIYNEYRNSEHLTYEKAIKVIDAFSQID